MVESTRSPRGSPATRSRFDRDRRIRLRGWETTGSGVAQQPIEEAAPGQPTGSGRFPGLTIFEPESRTSWETSLGRARRILGAELTYIAHPSFDDPGVRDAILAPMPAPDLARASRRPDAPAGSPPYLADVYREALLLSREQEAHLFRKMNYLKSRASRLRDRIDPARPRTADLDEIERLLDEALAIRTEIVLANLRLVVSIARRQLGPHDDLFERVSDGNYVLIRAIEGFDYARGNKFSTYATWAIRNQLGRAMGRGKNRRQPQFRLGHDEALEAADDPRTDDLERSDVEEKRQEVVARLLARLGDRERRILVGRYGIGGGDAMTLVQLGRELGITKERVRQIEARAQDKLRGLARTGELIALLA